MSTPSGTASRGKEAILPRLRCMVACVLWAAWLLGCPRVVAAPGPEFDQWTVEDGLPQNAVQAVLRTRDGYLWLATFDGLARFDGLRFTVFDKANTPGLQGSSLMSLHEDARGNLWIGHASGQISRYSKGTFTTLGREVGIASAPVHAIGGEHDGLPWLLSSAEPILVNGRPAPGFRLQKWEQGRYVDVAVPSLSAPFEDLWWNARESVIWSLNDSGLRAYAFGEERTVLGRAAVPTPQVLGACHDQAGNTWVLTRESGLVQMRDGKLVRAITEADGLPAAWQPDADSPRQIFVSEDRKGALWIAGMGLWLGRLKDGKFKAFPAPGPSGSRVNAFHHDGEGNLWIATDNDGLLRVREQVIRTHSTDEGLLAANIYPVCEDRHGAVWVGAWNLGLSRIKDGTVTNYTVDNGLPYPKLTSLYEDREGRLWIGTFGGLRYLENGAFHDGPEPLGRSGHVVSAILQDRSGTFWFGVDVGLWQFVGNKGRHITSRDGLAGDSVKAILEGRDGAIWVATYGGLTRIRDGVLTSWRESDGLPSESVRSLHETDDGAIWIGTTDGGLGRLKNGRFARFTVRDGMFNNGVFTILEDALGFFWMSCNKGIHRVSRRELERFADGLAPSISAVAYGESDGMRNIECNGGRWPSGVRTRDGHLWIPTQDGVAEVDPESVPADPRPPRVVIESCLAERRPMPVDRDVIIPPGVANFEIHYAGLSFVGAERVQYKYKLEGMDHDWVEAGTRRTAYFSHVPPGVYPFTVTAANRDGVWSGSGATLMVRVLPRWWQTVWIRALALVGAAAIIFGLFEIRVRRLRKQRAAQEAFSRLVLESQEAERKRIAVELHDGLGQNLLIAVNRAGMGARDCDRDPLAKRRLGEVEGLLHEAIEEVRAVSQNLRPAFLEKIGLTKSLRAAVKKAASASEIRFVEAIESIDDCFDASDHIHVYRLLQEALSNVMRHSHARTAHVRVDREHGWVQIEIRDDGRGFNPSALPTISKVGSGLGLVGMAERVHLLGGTWECRSERNHGTVLRMRLPVRPDPSSRRNS